MEALLQDTITLTGAATGAGCDFGVKEAVDRFCNKHGYRLHITTDDYWEGDPILHGGL
jgi:hypothetical protein